MPNFVSLCTISFFKFWWVSSFLCNFFLLCFKHTLSRQIYFRHVLKQNAAFLNKSQYFFNKIDQHIKLFRIFASDIMLFQYMERSILTTNLNPISNSQQRGSLAFAQSFDTYNCTKLLLKVLISSVKILQKYNTGIK